MRKCMLVKFIAGTVLVAGAPTFAAEPAKAPEMRAAAAYDWTDYAPAMPARKSCAACWR